MSSLVPRCFAVGPVSDAPVVELTHRKQRGSLSFLLAGSRYGSRAGWCAPLAAQNGVPSRMNVATGVQRAEAADHPLRQLVAERQDSLLGLEEEADRGLRCLEQSSFDPDLCTHTIDCMGLFKTQQGFDGLVTCGTAAGFTHGRTPVDFREHVPFGRTGLMVSRMGLAGGYGVPTAAIERAFHEYGINYFYLSFLLRGKAIRAIRHLVPRHRDELRIVLPKWPVFGGRFFQRFVHRWPRPTATASSSPIPTSTSASPAHPPHPRWRPTSRPSPPAPSTPTRWPASAASASTSTASSGKTRGHRLRDCFGTVLIIMQWAGRRASGAPPGAA